MSEQEIKITGTSKRPYKLGTTTTVDIDTGEVISEQRNAMTLMPCKPGVCQEYPTQHLLIDEVHPRIMIRVGGRIWPLSPTLTNNLPSLERNGRGRTQAYHTGSLRPP